MSETPDTGSGLAVGPVSIEVDAPAALVYQMLCAIGQGSSRPGERVEVVSRDGDELVCEFWSLVPLPVGRARVAHTREAVRFVPPDTVAYRHLDGPVRGLEETITAHPVDERRTRLEYRAVHPGGGWLARLRARLARPLIERVVRDHFADLKDRAEVRARRSRVFAPSGPVSGELVR